MWRGQHINEEFKAGRLRINPLRHFEDDVAEIAADAFFERAQHFFQIEVERPMQSTVNGLLLMASFSSGRAKPNLGRKYNPYASALMACDQSFCSLKRCVL